MKIYLIDDDANVIRILKKIITEREIGEVCGSSSNAEDALFNLRKNPADIILLDLLMPGMDGITFLRKAAEWMPEAAFVMLSQVSSKDMIAEAYKNGAVLFIQKPVNAIEVENVLRRVIQNLSMRRTLTTVQGLFHTGENAVSAPPAQSAAAAPVPAPERQKPYLVRARSILRSLGILGELGSKDILALIDYMASQDSSDHELPLHMLCRIISSSPKSAEQRIRRAVTAGLINLANLGLEDYSNDVFSEYANTLYNFEQVRIEMDHIRGKTAKHGCVHIKSFLHALLSYSLSENS